MSNHSNQGGLGSSEWLLGAVKKNPEGLLLLAAGCALLMRSRSSWSRSAASSSSSSSSSSDYRNRSDSAMHEQRGSDWGVTEGISRAAETARDYASDVTRSVGETANEYASAVGDYADKAKRNIVEGSERIAQQAQSTMQNTVDKVLREQPLAVALAGLAAGALWLPLSLPPRSSVGRSALPARAWRMQPQGPASSFRRPHPPQGSTSWMRPKNADSQRAARRKWQARLRTPSEAHSPAIRRTRTPRT